MKMTNNYSHNSDSIRISETKDTRRAILIVGIVLSIFTLLIIYFTTGFQPRFPTIGIASVLVSMIFLTCRHLYNRLATALLKQDLIFVSHPNLNSRPVKLTWVKSAKSIPFFGLSLCKITYRYDGVKYSSLLIGKKENFKTYLKIAC
jgi:hypothetical protein